MIHLFFSNSFYIASHGAPINSFLGTSFFLFLQTFLHISSISFYLDPWIFCDLLPNLFPSFLCFFGCCECWIPWTSHVMWHTSRKKITSGTTKKKKRRKKERQLQSFLHANTIDSKSLSNSTSILLSIINHLSRCYVF